MAQQRLLIGSIVGMGIAIVVCLIILGVEVAKRAGNFAADVTADAIGATAKPTGETSDLSESKGRLALPAGADIRQIELDGDNLAVWFTGADGRDEILVIDLDDRQETLRIGAAE